MSSKNGVDNLFLIDRKTDRPGILWRFAIVEDWSWPIAGRSHELIRGIRPTERDVPEENAIQIGTPDWILSRGWAAASLIADVH